MEGHGTVGLLLAIGDAENNGEIRLAIGRWTGTAFKQESPSSGNPRTRLRKSNMKIRRTVRKEVSSNAHPF